MALVLSMLTYRYLIVVDDIWHTSTWKDIGLAFVDSNLGSRIVMTSRNSQISAKIGGEVYVINKLSDDNSRKLFYARISDKEGDKMTGPIARSNLREGGGELGKLKTLTSSSNNLHNI